MTWPFNYFISAKHAAKQQELIETQDRIINSLELALANADEKTVEATTRGRATIAALLMASGGEVKLGKEIIDIASTSNYKIDIADAENDGMILSIVPLGDEEEGGISNEL